MQKVNGIFLPATDTHFPFAIGKNPMFAGKGTYQLKKLQAALLHVKHPASGWAVDVGAHVGLWTHVLAHQFERVCAFEPNAALASCWRENCGSFNNVELTQCALGRTECQAPMVVVANNSGNTRMSHNGESTVELVRVVPLDQVLDKLAPVKFIKIDVEGYEYEVVTGGEELIRHNKPVMVVEQKRGNAERYGHKTGAVLDLLKSWGASIVWEMSGDYCLTWG